MIYVRDDSLLPGPCTVVKFGRACQAEAAWEIVCGCIHEHVEVSRVCSADRAQAELLASALICVYCQQHPSRPHECPAMITVRAGAHR